MGKFADSDEEYTRKLKKKKKTKKRSRTRSRSASSGESRYSYSHSKHNKKSKKKHRQRSKSRSRSPDRLSRRDRSPGRKRRSRSPDRSRRSRSFDRGRRSRSAERRRSRSYERTRRSRSYSRGRRSRSDSRGRVHSRKRSSSKDRDRRSRSNSGSRRSTPDRRKGTQSASPSHTPNLSESNTMDSVPGFADMTPSEQAQVRLRLALRAAAAADEKLKDHSTASPSNQPSSPLSRREFADAVASIESDAFTQSVFKSGRTPKSLKETREVGDMSSHHMAMFGAVGSSVVFTKTEPMDKSLPALENDPETLFDPCLNVDPEVKMERWIEKLSAMRRKRLEGEIILIGQ